jgi:hypothetical protein
MLDAFRILGNEHVSALKHDPIVRFRLGCQEIYGKVVWDFGRRPSLLAVSNTVDVYQRRAKPPIVAGWFISPCLLLILPRCIPLK